MDKYDLSALRAILSGAAPLDEDLGHAVADRIGCRVVQGYGMTELSPVSHCTPLDGGKRLVGSVAPIGAAGWTAANSASKLIDPTTGDEIGIPDKGLSEAGELWFKGPNVMAGYLGNDEGHQRKPSTTTAGCAPETWPASTRPAASTSSTGSRN